MIVGNKHPADVLRKYINTAIETWNGTQFFLLAWPNWIWKIAHAKELIEEILWWYMYSDCLFVQDYSPFVWKTHTIPVEIKKEEDLWIRFPDEPKDEPARHQNYWVREMNEWLLNSSFSGKKFLLIENIQRMSNSAINAFLKSAEEPLPNKFIIATVPHVSMVLDTIRSRSITIQFEPLNRQEMQEFAKENQLNISDKNLENILISMAMWKPGFLKTLYNKISQNENLQDSLKNLTKWLQDSSFPKWQIIQSLKGLSEEWILNDFLEWWISYCTSIEDFEQSERRIKVKKYISSNVNLDSALIYGLIS